MALTVTEIHADGTRSPLDSEPAGLDGPDSVRMMMTWLEDDVTGHPVVFSGPADRWSNMYLNILLEAEPRFRIKRQQACWGDGIAKWIALTAAGDRDGIVQTAVALSDRAIHKFFYE